AVGFLWLMARPGALPEGPTPVPTAAGSASPGLAISDAEVVVHVAGAVVSPGVYTLPGGSRVGDAVTAAGGPRRRAVLDGLNLARVLTDGEQVLVAAKGDSAASETAGAAAAGATPGAGSATVNLNRATVPELETLPGIGPVLAERIIQHRDSVGGFKDVGELRDVPGIGEKTFQALSELISV
ncbi:MAG: ComEA family DNA-binding protein, partial [Nitriliruptorales bacterium]|nr:ComEA family DNA-binding protein [Nitriliruptorales bacterium]